LVTTDQIWTALDIFRFRDNKGVRDSESFYYMYDKNKQSVNYIEGKKEYNNGDLQQKTTGKYFHLALKWCVRIFAECIL
jgi:hypothetical protein